MRPWERLKAVVGLLAVAAMLLLASPGVRAVRAAGPQEPAAAQEQAQCGSTARAPADPEVQAFLAELRREQLERAIAGAGDSGIVVLNNRGYNYGPASGIELDAIRAEAAAAARR
jgi:hypothetical protein